MTWSCCDRYVNVRNGNACQRITNYFARTCGLLEGASRRATISDVMWPRLAGAIQRLGAPTWSVIEVIIFCTQHFMLWSKPQTEKNKQKQKQTCCTRWRLVICSSMAGSRLSSSALASNSAKEREINDMTVSNAEISTGALVGFLCNRLRKSDSISSWLFKCWKEANKHIGPSQQTTPFCIDQTISNSKRTFCTTSTSFSVMLLANSNSGQLMFPCRKASCAFWCCTIRAPTLANNWVDWNVEQSLMLISY